MAALPHHGPQVRLACDAREIVSHAMIPRKILLLHNRYQQQGGEDTVVAAEHDLLARAGYAVDTLILTNDNIGGVVKQAQAALFTAYNPTSRRLVRQKLRANRPDIVHVHNFFPRFSPSIFDACRDENVPVVMTLHNYRLACANGLLFREGRPCEACIGGNLLHAVRHACYRKSRLGSAAVAAMIGYHRQVGTWHNKVTRFIALTEFARTRMIAAGLPPARIRIKPNFIADPHPAADPLAADGEAYALFVGRLSPEKGASTLIDAWQGIDLPLRIVGDGPERAQLVAKAPANATFIGQLDRQAVLRQMANASFLIVPSVWYEGFPMTVVETMALGVPVIAAAIGSLRDLLDDGIEGRHFIAGDAQDLRRVVHEMVENPLGVQQMGIRARQRYLSQLSPERNLAMLTEIYHEMVAMPDPY
ncbi:glycosyltransferase [Sphingomonas sp. S6]|jgi:glycosyltransferase involved in cell wall biosynthesis|uniref:glycosyltransferase n=1 Tax=Sphingomonas sp. S6 TaxID=3368600 RepID=UPI00373EE23C